MQQLIIICCSEIRKNNQSFAALKSKQANFEQKNEVESKIKFLDFYHLHDEIYHGFVRPKDIFV